MKLPKLHPAIQGAIVGLITMFIAVPIFTLLIWWMQFWVRMMK